MHWQEHVERIVGRVRREPFIEGALLRVVITGNGRGASPMWTSARHRQQHRRAAAGVRPARRDCFAGRRAGASSRASVGA